MTHRPDYADHPGGEAARMAQHQHDDDCDCEPVVHAPSPGFRFCPYRPLLWKDVPMLLAIFRESTDSKLEDLRKAIQTSTRALVRKLDNLEHVVSVSTDKILADIQTLVDGGKAKDLLIAQLQAEVASAGADAQTRVDAAVAAEDVDAQSKIDAADAVAAEYLNPAPVDAPPADGGDVPPADDGSGAVA